MSVRIVVRWWWFAVVLQLGLLLSISVSVCSANEVQDLARDILAQPTEPGDGCILHNTFAASFCIQGKDRNNLRDLQRDGITANRRQQIRITQGLARVLKSLYDTSRASGKAWSIMSLAEARGPHGSVLKHHAAFGKLDLAVDISHFAGHHIHIRNPGEACAGIEALIAALPAGVYNFGFPREVAEWTRGQVSAFLPNRNRQRSPTGSLHGDLASIQNPQIRERLTTAFTQASARGVCTSYLYPDDINHLHVSITSEATPSTGTIPPAAAAAPCAPPRSRHGGASHGARPPAAPHARAPAANRRHH